MQTSTIMSTSLTLFIVTATFSLLFSASQPTTATLLSLNCTQPPPTINVDFFLSRILDQLIDQIETARVRVSNVTVNRTTITGLVQCRSNLDQTQCGLCVRFAKRTVLTQCPNSGSMAAWLDDCYVEASMAGLPPRSTLTRYCSNQLPVQGDVGVEPDFSAILLRLRSGVAIQHDGFSYANTASEGGYKVDVKTECIRSLSTSECRSCIEEALGKLHRSCRGRAQGLVIVGRCLAKFELSLESTSANLQEGGSRVRKLVLLIWGVVVACLVGFVLSVWLIQRSIVNQARVGVIDDTIEEDSAKL